MPTLAPPQPPTPAGAVVRIEVSPAPGHADPMGEAVRRDAAALGVSLGAARATHVFLIQAHADEPLSAEQVERVRRALLTDPVTESSRLGAAPPPPGARVVEVHPLPGVMDPVAQSVTAAIRDLLGLEREPLVSTGWRYDLVGEARTGLSAEQADLIATRLLANPVIQRVHAEPFQPAAFPVSQPHGHEVRRVRLIGLGDAELERLSREAHLFLSLDEMRAIQAYYGAKGEDPREIELETLAQTWSEHCVHKTLKSTIRYRSDGATQPRSGGGEGDSRVSAPDPVSWTDRPGHAVLPDGSVVIHNLLKQTVAAATHRLIAEGLDWTLSVFVDNAGVIAFDDEHAVCVKVETHNHPSAIEPYGGAATGVGGCIRDVIGTGLAARPIANTDVFCVAFPDGWSDGATERSDGGWQDMRVAGSGNRVSGEGAMDPTPGTRSPIPDSDAPSLLPEGALHPRRILAQVVAGVRDYGNRMGIPTVSGAVAFDDRYVGNPLVFCGCVGVMPRDKVRGKVRRGDLIVALGGRTGRDGIHGATFSSAELEHTATDEFAHAVQIGNPITEKQVLDAIMRARDEGPGRAPLFSGLTDCGAGGFSSAVGEMGKDTGAVVHLDRAPLKYAGLSPTEIWISEAQERMVLAVPRENLEHLRRICAEESVEMAVLGTFEPAPGSTEEEPDLQLLFHGQEVGRLSTHFLHEGIPTPHREATWTPGAPALRTRAAPPPLRDALLALLSHPDIASKHWIIRQYDHEVRGNTALKPLVGPASRGPGDASVIKPVPTSKRGLAISQGLQTGVGDPALGGDPYLMALAAIDECVRNLVCVGADPERIAILDNFCWPSCRKPENLGLLVRAAEGCYDGALAYRTPFVSGKDSLNNQFTTRDGRTIEIPPTLLITGIGIVEDVSRCVTMDAKRAGTALLLVGPHADAMGGSRFQRRFGLADSIGVAAVASVPRADLELGPRVARAVAGLIGRGLVASAHDVSDGGALVAVAEMLIAGSTAARPLGARVDLAAIAAASPWTAAFCESPCRYVLEVACDDLQRVEAALAGVPLVTLGQVTDTGVLEFDGGIATVAEMTGAWMRPLDW